MVRVLSILSRDYSMVSDVGRKAIVSRWIKVLEARHDFSVFIPRMAIESGKATMLGAIARRCLFGNEALQVALFDTAENVSRLAQAIRESRPQVIHVDGGRLVPLLKRALAQCPGGREGYRIIVDIDDLMFRRYRIYKKLGLGLELGVLGEKLTAYTRFAGSAVSDGVLSLESARMRRLEESIVHFADDVVFSSDYERRLLAHLAGPRRARLHRHVIGYNVAPVTPRLDPQTLRFAFIGGDKLSQNRLSIEGLIRIWKTYDIPHELLIIGKCHHTYEAHPRIKFTGFVEKLAEWYSKVDGLIIFSYVPGGLKTKIPEGLSFGLPAIVNRVAAEGVVGLEDYSFCFDESEMVEFLHSSPDEIRRRLAAERARAPEIAQKYWSSTALEAFLHDLFKPASPSPTPSPRPVAASGPLVIAPAKAL